MTTRRPRGFTLVEILVVVVIIGILAGIGINTSNPLLASAGEGEPVCR